MPQWGGLRTAQPASRESEELLVRRVDDPAGRGILEQPIDDVVDVHGFSGSRRHALDG